MTRDKTRYFKFVIPEGDDLIDITTALNNALDVIDQRIGDITQFGWTLDTTISNVGHTASAEESRVRRLNKTQWHNYHITISTVTGSIEFIPGGSDGAQIISGEPDYQDSGFDSPGPFDLVGTAVAYDVSLNQYHFFRVMTSAANAGRVRLETNTAAAINATTPFTWAAGDFLSVQMFTQTIGTQP